MSNKKKTNQKNLSLILFSSVIPYSSSYTKTILSITPRKVLM